MHLKYHVAFVMPTLGQAEAGESVQGQPQLSCQVEASVGYMSQSQNIKVKKQETKCLGFKAQSRADQRNLRPIRLSEGILFSKVVGGGSDSW